MKRFGVILALLLLSTLLSAKPVDVDDSGAIAARLVEVLDITIQDGYPVYLDIDAGPYTDSIYERMVKHLMQSGVTILNRASDECLVLMIRHTGFDFSDDEEKDTDRMKFLVELSSNQTGEIFSISEVSFEVENALSEEEAAGIHWYDPIIITTIVGGLIYVFYYGNQ